MLNLIKQINALRNVPHSALNLLVKKVVVILTSPRSGSSVVKSVLSSHPEIATLDGEIEPFLVLTKNGYGFNSDSDALKYCSNSAALANQLVDQLTVPSEKLPSPVWIKEQWKKRLLLHFPKLFSEKKGFQHLLQALDEALLEVRSQGLVDEKRIQGLMLEKVLQQEPWRMNYYDGYGGTSAPRPFDAPFKIEEPPFVLPRLYRRSITAEDTEQKWFLFKSPPDVYRMGMYEQLFPNARLQYIHLTRGFAQTVNGLMDGWLSPIGFFSHDLRKSGVELNIRGYSDSVTFGKDWWKFDLFPHWKQFVDAELSEVCFEQWNAAHRSILGNQIPMLRIAFEQFLSDPIATVNQITDALGLDNMHMTSTVPVVMATETPRLRRWKKRERLMLTMAKQKTVHTMMKRLGYSMDPETWI